MKNVFRKGLVYYNACDIIFLACFTALERWIEEEDPFEIHIYEEDMEKEIKTLYEWWKKRKNVDIWSLEEDDEEQEMLMRLVKIREHMWT